MIVSHHYQERKRGWFVRYGHENDINCDEFLTVELLSAMAIIEIQLRALREQRERIADLGKE